MCELYMWWNLLLICDKKKEIMDIKDERIVGILLYILYFVFTELMASLFHSFSFLIYFIFSLSLLSLFFFFLFYYCYRSFRLYLVHSFSQDLSVWRASRFVLPNEPLSALWHAYKRACNGLVLHISRSST